MSHPTTQRGTALVAVLIIMMIVLPIGGFVVLQCRTDFLVHHNLRAEAEAFYVAEAGLQHALTEISPGDSFADILAGPDHVSGNVDDGVFPFWEGVPSDFPASPFHYDVRVTSNGPGLVELVSTGAGRNGATKAVDALVARSPLPSTPGSFYADGDAVGLDLGNGGFLLSGFDHALGDASGAPTGTTAPVPAMAVSTPNVESAVRLQLQAAGAAQLVGRGGVPSIATTAPFDLPAFAQRCASQPSRVQLPGGVAGAGPSLGTPGAPQISIAVGDVDVIGTVNGAGILVVQGALHVAGTLTFTGLVLATGGIRFEPSSTVTITGALWRAASQDDRMEFRGNGAVMYSSAALAAVDAALVGLLPHAAVMVGWQELL
jgi:hypothetical protein